MERRWLFPVIAVGLALAATVVLAEVGLRLVRPTPRVQIVRAGVLTELDPGEVAGDDVPLWRTSFDDPRHNEACLEDNPGARVWVVLGSSILAADGLAPSAAFNLALQERLRPELGPLCILNLAEGGYTFDNQLAVAREAIPRLEPELVLWEVWENSPFRWAMVGGHAYRFQHVAVGADGLPNPMGVPSAVHRTLFSRSRLYEYSVLALVERPADAASDPWNSLLDDRLDEARALVEAYGELVVVFAPHLDMPFEERIAAREARTSPLDRHYADVEQWARGRGVESVYLDVLLRDLDVTDVRLDPCCHYNVEGHLALADRFATWWSRR
jgi:hypothetical protein